MSHVGFSEAALDAAARVGLLTDERRVDRPATVARIIEFLNHQPATSEDEVEGAARTIEEITSDVFKSDDEELRSLVAQLCSTSPEGAVQHRLNGGGKMLCSKRVERMLQDPVRGITIRRTFAGRFVSGATEVVLQHLVELYTDRLTRSTARADQLLKLAVHRIPALQPAVDQRRLQATLRMRALLAPQQELGL
jgi:hypothetical protein